MHKKKNRLLAIDPGSREMGIAVLEGTEIVHHGVKSLKKYRPPRVLRQVVSEILQRLIVEYAVTTIAVEDGHFSQIASTLYMAVVETISSTAKQNDLVLATYAPNTIRKLICGNGKATKRRAARAIAARYPELEIYLEQNYRWKEKYWMNVFDAIAVGVTHVQMGDHHGR